MFVALVIWSFIFGVIVDLNKSSILVYMTHLVVTCILVGLGLLRIRQGVFNGSGDANSERDREATLSPEKEAGPDVPRPKAEE